MTKKTPDKKRNDLVITNAPDLKAIVDIIAENYEITTSAYLKKMIRSIVNSEPERMKIKKPQH